MGTHSTGVAIGNDCKVATVYTRSEVSLHNSSEDCWIIISGKVYNVTYWLDTHPGGRDILQYHGGQDATIPFHSFHSNMKKATSYMKSYYIGDLVPEERELPAIDRDFMELRRQLIQKGLFKSNPYHFICQSLLALSLEAIAAALLYNYTNSWIVWCVAIIIVVIAQAHAIELNHNVGHRTLFKSLWMNKFGHCLTVGTVVGLFPTWWSDNHTLHHAKTNLYEVDPYITAGEYMAILGTLIPKKWGREKKGRTYFKYQHIYAIFIICLSLVPINYFYHGVKMALQRKAWSDFFWISLFFIRWHLMFSTALGSTVKAFLFCYAVRTVFSVWFASVSLTNHFPMEVEYEDKLTNWIDMHVAGTCNVSSNRFIDWYMINLNFQIEHHLFPDMPTYNNRLAHPYVQALCQKYNIDYQVKPFFIAFKDIYVGLRRSGQLWWNEYQKDIDDEKTD